MNEPYILGSAIGSGLVCAIVLGAWFWEQVVSGRLRKIGRMRHGAVEGFQDPRGETGAQGSAPPAPSTRWLPGRRYEWPSMVARRRESQQVIPGGALPPPRPAPPPPPIPQAEANARPWTTPPPIPQTPVYSTADILCLNCTMGGQAQAQAPAANAPGPPTRYEIARGELHPRAGQEPNGKPAPTKPCGGGTILHNQ